MINPEFKDLYIEESTNPYKQCIQGLSNEPICVHALLVKSEQYLKNQSLKNKTPKDNFSLGDISLEQIVERLVSNRARVVVITGSPDHPAHILDEQYMLAAVAKIWQNGGVPFTFGIPIICDGTAQNNIGQSYSLASRNQTATMININFEGHGYHAAWVISGCDKSPSGILSGLAAAELARTKSSRKQAPVWATFVPAHVLRGGEIPFAIQQQLDVLEQKAIAGGFYDLATDLKDNRRYILQCSSDEAFWGLLQRAQQLNLIEQDHVRALMNGLAVATCDKKGGICAFNGTGNSSRTMICALGFVPKSLELLCSAPTVAQVFQSIDQLFRLFNKPEFSVRNLLKANFENSVKIHSATGSSSNFLLHLPAIMRYAGFDVTIDDYARIRSLVKIPEIFAHSLTEHRDTYVLAQQFNQQQHHGIESLYSILKSLNIPLNLNAPTIEGTDWQTRIKTHLHVVDPNLKPEQSIIRTTPIRNESGTEILKGNFCSSAVLKVSGMETAQQQYFNKRLFIVRYYENEHVCNADIINQHLLAKLAQMPELNETRVRSLARFNHFEFNTNTEQLIHDGLLSFCFIIGGQGPKAYGMPELFSPSQNMRHHKTLERSSLLITDGRYSGVTKGACIGHVTPEAFEGGGIGALINGDVVQLDLEKKQLNVVDPLLLDQGQLVIRADFPKNWNREAVISERIAQTMRRQFDIAACSLMSEVTDAQRGVIPKAVDQRAVEKLLYL